MKSRSRQAEVMARTNRIKSQLNRLKRHKDFTPDYAPWTSEGNPCEFLSYTHLGVEARLRYSQETGEWRATCPHFNIEISFPDQDAQNIKNILNDWLSGHLAHIATENDRWRMKLPAVQSLGEQHGVSQVETLEIYRLRGE